MGWLEWLFDASGFQVPTACGGWTDGLVDATVMGNLAIWLIFTTIAALLVVFHWGKANEPIFHRHRLVAFGFAGIFLLCGGTHLTRAISFYYPAYRLSAVVTVGTVAWAWLTLCGMIPILLRRQWMESKEATDLAADRLELIQKRMLEDEASLNRFLYKIQHPSNGPEQEQ